MAKKKFEKKKWNKPQIEKLPFKNTRGGASTYTTENVAPGFYIS